MSVPQNISTFFAATSVPNDLCNSLTGIGLSPSETRMVVHTHTHTHTHLLGVLSGKFTYNTRAEDSTYFPNLQQSFTSEGRNYSCFLKFFFHNKSIMAVSYAVVERGNPDDTQALKKFHASFTQNPKVAFRPDSDWKAQVVPLNSERTDNEFDSKKKKLPLQRSVALCKKGQSFYQKGEVLFIKRGSPFQKKAAGFSKKAAGFLKCKNIDNKNKTTIKTSPLTPEGGIKN